MFIVRYASKQVTSFVGLYWYNRCVLRNVCQKMCVLKCAHDASGLIIVEPTFLDKLWIASNNSGMLVEREQSHL